MERGWFPLFFIGEKMLINIASFLIGMIVMWCIQYLQLLGSTIYILKDVQRNIAAMFVASETGIQEILQLKYIAMKEAKRTEQNITAQMHIDQVSVQSLRKAVMTNYVSAFPSSYLSAIEYTSWEEMADYVNREAQKNKEKRR